MKIDILKKLHYFGPKKKLMLLTILLLAFSLRFVGVKPGYNQYHPDEDNIYSTTTSFSRNNNFKPLRFDYSSGPALINLYFYKTTFIPVKVTKYFLSNFGQIFDGMIRLPLHKDIYDRVMQFEIFGDRDINALFWTRYVTALFSFLSVFLLYYLAKELFNKNVGLISSFILAVNFKSVQNAHFGLPDSYNVFFLILTLILCLKVYQKNSLKNYIFLGILSGITFSIKYQTLFLIPLFFTQILVLIKNKDFSLYKILDSKFIISLLIIPLIFLLINPFFLINIQDSISTLRYISQKYGVGSKKINLYPVYYLIDVDYGIPLLLSSMLGIIISLKKGFSNIFIILSFIVSFVYLFFYYSTGGFYVRNLITLSPFLFIFTGYLIYKTYIYLKKRIGVNISTLLTVIIFIFCTYKTLYNSFINSYYYIQKWNYDSLKEWEVQNLPKGIIIASKNFDPVLVKDIKKTEFEHEGAFSIAEHKENGAQYSLLNLDWAGDRFYYWMKFGLDKNKYLLGKPLYEMRNTYFGLASEEMFRYQIYSILKPWQAPDANLIISKFNDWPNFKQNKIEEYSFNDNLEGWQILNPKSEENTYQYYRSQENDALKYAPTDQKFSIERISSPLIKVKGGHLYKVIAYFRSEKVISSKNRDGFLRLDFYNNNDNINLPGIISSVSSRLHSSSEWIKKEIVERAPNNSDFLIVSFEATCGTTNILFDDVVVYESNEYFDDPTNNIPYVKKEIDLNLLYPYSHGNL